MSRHPLRAVGVTAGIVLLAAGAAIAADRVAAAVAAMRIADGLATEVAGEGVDVAVGGFPFLTQLAAGALEDVSYSLDSVTLEGLALTDVSGTASGVATDGSGIDALTVHGTLPTASLQQAVDDRVAGLGSVADALGGVIVTPHDGGITASVDVLGLTAVQAEITPEPAGREILLSVSDLRVAGMSVDPADLPFGLGDSIQQALDGATVSLEGLPAGSEVTAVTPSDAGVELTVEGTDVVLP